MGRHGFEFFWAAGGEARGRRLDAGLPFLRPDRIFWPRLALGPGRWLVSIAAPAAFPEAAARVRVRLSALAACW